MPLIQCPECGNMISDKAVKCTKCGYPVGQTQTSSPTHSFNDGGEDYYAEKPSSRKWIYALIGVLVVALAVVAFLLFGRSGKPEEKVKTFVSDFAMKVSQNQKDSLLSVWPDVTKADSLALTYNADSIKVEPMQTDNQFKVHLGDADMVVTMNNEGKMTVTESRGLFAWPADKVSLALATGWITKELNDLQKAERFADSLFINSLSDKFMSGLKTKLKATCEQTYANYESGEARWTVTVRNDNDFDIPADAYSIVLKEMGWDVERMVFVVAGTKYLNGITVNARSKASCRVPGRYDFEYCSFRASIKVKYDKEQTVKNLLKPTGNEYAEYLAEKGK